MARGSGLSPAMSQVDTRPSRCGFVASHTARPDAGPRPCRDGSLGSHPGRVELEIAPE
jgi:hypothetical protein